MTPEEIAEKVAKELDPYLDKEYEMTDAEFRQAVEEEITSVLRECLKGEQK